MSGKAKSEREEKAGAGPTMRVEGVVPVTRLQELLRAEPELRIEIAATRPKPPQPPPEG